jgi:hypothetical protein
VCCCLSQQMFLVCHLTRFPDCKVLWPSATSHHAFVCRWSRIHSLSIARCIGLRTGPQTTLLVLGVGPLELLCNRIQDPLRFQDRAVIAARRKQYIGEDPRNLVGSISMDETRLKRAAKGHSRPPQPDQYQFRYCGRSENEIVAVSVFDVLVAHATT